MEPANNYSNSLEKISNKDDKYFETLKNFDQSENFFINYNSFYNAFMNCAISLPNLDPNSASPSQMENYTKLKGQISIVMKIYVDLAGEFVYFLTKLKLNNKTISDQTTEILSCENTDQLNLTMKKSNMIMENFGKEMETIDVKWQATLKEFNDYYNKDLMSNIIENVKTVELKCLLEDIEVKQTKLEQQKDKFQNKITELINQLMSVQKEMAQFQAELVSSETQINYLNQMKNDCQKRKDNLSSLIQSLDNNLCQNEESYRNILQEKSKELENQKKNMEESMRARKQKIISEYENRLSNLRDNQTQAYDKYRNLPSEITQYDTVKEVHYGWFITKTTYHEISKTVSNQAKRDQEIKVNQINKEISSVEESYKNVLPSLEGIFQKDFQQMQSSAQQVFLQTKQNYQNFKEGFENLKQSMKNDLAQLDSQLENFSEKLGKASSIKEKDLQLISGIQIKINAIQSEIKSVTDDHQGIIKKLGEEIEAKSRKTQEILERTGHQSEKALFYFSETLKAFFDITGQFKIKLNAVIAFISSFKEKILMNKNQIEEINSSKVQKEFDVLATKNYFIEWGKKAFPKAKKFLEILEDNAASVEDMQELYDDSNSNIEKMMEFFALNKLQVRSFRRELDKFYGKKTLEYKKTTTVNQFKELQNLTSLKKEKEVNENLESIKQQ